MINNSEDIQKQTDQRICFSGETEYPVHVTYVDLNRSYMNRIGWNWHPEIEVFLVEEGSAIIYYDDSQISLEVGQGVIINQNVMHSILSVSPSQSCKLFSYAFHPSFLFGDGDTLFTSKYVTPLLHQLFDFRQQPFVFHDVISPSPLNTSILLDFRDMP